MKPTNILKKGLYTGLAVVGAAMLTGTAIAEDLGKRNVREQTYDCLKKFDGKLEYNTTIGDYEIIVGTGLYSDCLALTIKMKIEIGEELKDIELDFRDSDDDRFKKGIQLGKIDRIYINNKEMPEEEISQKHEQIMDNALSRMILDLEKSAIAYTPKFEEQQRQERQEREKIFKELAEAFK